MLLDPNWPIVFFVLSIYCLVRGSRACFSYPNRSTLKFGFRPIRVQARATQILRWWLWRRYNVKFKCWCLKLKFRHRVAEIWLGQIGFFPHSTHFRSIKGNKLYVGLIVCSVLWKFRFSNWSNFLKTEPNKIYTIKVIEQAHHQDAPPKKSPAKKSKLDIQFMAESV